MSTSIRQSKDLKCLANGSKKASTVTGTVVTNSAAFAIDFVFISTPRRAWIVKECNYDGTSALSICDTQEMSELAKECFDKTPVRFSVVIVCLNAEKYIGEVLGSVIEQGYPSFELVVIDGGSTDGTLAVIDGYQKRRPELFRLVCEKDNGIYDAMNKGLALARGDYVVYLGADDRMTPDALAVVATAAERHGHPQIICGATRVFGDGGTREEPARSFRGSGIPKRAPSRHQSIYVAREALVAIGGFDLSWRIASDYEAYLRLVERGAEELLIPEILSEFRLGGVSSTLCRATASEYREIRVAHGAHPVFQWLVMVKSLTAIAVLGVLRRFSSARRKDS